MYHSHFKTLRRALKLIAKKLLQFEIVQGWFLSIRKNPLYSSFFFFSTKKYLMCAEQYFLAMGSYWVSDGYERIWLDLLVKLFVALPFAQESDGRASPLWCFFERSIFLKKKKSFDVFFERSTSQKNINADGSLKKHQRKKMNGYENDSKRPTKGLGSPLMFFEEINL